MGSSYAPPPSGRAKKKFWYAGVDSVFFRALARRVDVRTTTTTTVDHTERQKR